MKAYVLHDINDLRYEDIEKPKTEENSVVVEVRAAGICGSDIPRIYRTGTYSYPLILGHEFAGVVSEIGAEVSPEWLGKRVGVFPLIPCRECSSCKKNYYEMCKNYSYLGSRTDGGFAEYVRVPVWNLIELPDGISMEQAAMLEPMAVAVHAIRRSKVKKSNSIAVCGLGTIGLFVLMFLREMGCENIYVAGNKESQKKLVQSLGISVDDYCDIKNQNLEEWIWEKTAGNGVDVFFECVGKNDTLTQGLNCATAGGTVRLVGNPASDMKLPKDVYWKILRKQLAVYGTWNSSFLHAEEDDWHYVLERLQREAIQPERMITHRFPLEKLKDGFELMRDKKEDYVKIMGYSDCII